MWVGYHGSGGLGGAAGTVCFGWKCIVRNEFDWMGWLEPIGLREVPWIGWDGLAGMPNGLDRVGRIGWNG